MQKPHHLSAVFIGGFGIRKPNAEARMAKVSVRRKDTGSILPNQAAASICYEYGLYEVQRPSADLPATYADDW